MDTNELTLLVFDTPEHFQTLKDLLGFEGTTVKRLTNVSTLDDLVHVVDKQLDDDDQVLLVVHVRTKESLIGVKKFLASGIRDRYPELEFCYISEGKPKKEVQKELLDQDLDPLQVFRPHEIRSSIRSGQLRTSRVRTLRSFSSRNIVVSAKANRDGILDEGRSFDYAIMTALERDEMERFLPHIVCEGEMMVSEHFIEYGHLKGRPEKSVVYASQLATGMVDAAVLASELIIRFRPKFLILAGVLGGKPDEVEIGDVVVATEVFTIDKGKITGTKDTPTKDTRKRPDERYVKTAIDGKIVEGKVETKRLGFLPEPERSSTNGPVVTKIERRSEDIVSFLKANDSHGKGAKLHFGPIACVRSVIDLPGFFEEKITPVDRKAVALEMESYGFARAAHLLGKASVTPLIIKSAMDNTKDKDDHAKSFAAWTSAQVVLYLIEKDII